MCAPLCTTPHLKGPITLPLPVMYSVSRILNFISDISTLSLTNQWYTCNKDLSSLSCSTQYNGHPELSVEEQYTQIEAKITNGMRVNYIAGSGCKSWLFTSVVLQYYHAMDTHYGDVLLCLNESHNSIWWWILLSLVVSSAVCGVVVVCCLVHSWITKKLSEKLCMYVLLICPCRGEGRGDLTNIMSWRDLVCLFFAFFICLGGILTLIIIW